MNELLFVRPTHTGPRASRVIVGLDVVTDTLKLISALAQVLERGTYPIDLARDTTFSLKTAESKKDSLTTMFALNALMYVLYANAFKITEKLDPSKSKSEKSEFARR
jgi:hypothetical protein